MLDVCEYLETKGAEITYLDVEQNGLIKLDELKNSIKENTILVSIMYANNETGVIQDIEKIGQTQEGCASCPAWPPGPHISFLLQAQLTETPHMPTCLSHLGWYRYENANCTQEAMF